MNWRAIVGSLIWVEVIAAILLPSWALAFGLVFVFLALFQPLDVKYLLVMLPIVVGGSLGTFALLRVTYSVTFGDPSNVPVRLTYAFAAGGLASLVAADAQFEGTMRRELLVAAAVSLQIWCMWLAKMRRRRSINEEPAA